MCENLLSPQCYIRAGNLGEQNTDVNHFPEKDRFESTVNNGKDY